MAIPAVNLSYVGKGPTANGETLANNEGGPLGKALVGYGTATLDGAATTFTVNFIDGTKTPFGTWSGPAGNQVLTAAKPALIKIIRVFDVNGTDDTAAATVTAIVSAVSTTGFTVTLSGADVNAHTLSFVAEIYPSLS